MTLQPLLNSFKGPHFIYIRAFLKGHVWGFIDFIGRLRIPLTHTIKLIRLNYLEISKTPIIQFNAVIRILQLLKVTLFALV